VILLLLIAVMGAGQRGAGGPDAMANAPASASAAPTPVGASRAVNSLREGKYPWYDAGADRLMPVWPLRITWLKWIGKQMRLMLEAIGRFFDRFKFSAPGRLPITGNAVATTLLMAVLLAFFFWIFMLWLGRQSGSFSVENRRDRPATAARIGNLPEGLRPGADVDLWAEAQKRRASGDLAGSIVCLFAHQLLMLDQQGLIRLAPGKTGRHYVGGLRDRRLVDALNPTLRLFEDVYYGRKPPEPAAFESAWKQAWTIEKRLREPGAGALS
jgi:hypothetical protein